MKREFKDKIAVVLSMICILQCLFLPVLVTALPVLDIWWLADSFLHPLMLLIVIPLTFVALVPGYKQHHNKQPFFIAIPALLVLIYGASIPESLFEKFLTISGASLLAVAHLINITLNRRYKTRRQKIVT